MNDISTLDTTMGNITQLSVCGYKSIKKPGLPEKMQWNRYVVQHPKIAAKCDCIATQD